MDFHLLPTGQYPGTYYGRIKDLFSKTVMAEGGMNLIHKDWLLNYLLDRHEVIYFGAYFI